MSYATLHPSYVLGNTGFMDTIEKMTRQRREAKQSKREENNLSLVPFPRLHFIPNLPAFIILIFAAMLITLWAHLLLK